MKLEAIYKTTNHISRNYGLQVLMVDDHALVRTGLELLILEIDKSAQVVQASSSSEALAVVEHNPYFDLILLDVDIPDMNGLCLLPKLLEISPEASIVVITGNEDFSLKEKALALGAKNYLTKNTNSHIIKKTLDQVIQAHQEKEVSKGRVLHEQRITDTQDLASLFNSRQLQILECLAQGMADAKISQAISIPEASITNHITTILELLAVSNRTQAVVEAARRGLI